MYVLLISPPCLLATHTKCMYEPSTTAQRVLLPAFLLFTPPYAPCWLGRDYLHTTHLIPLLYYNHASLFSMSGAFQHPTTPSLTSRHDYSIHENTASTSTQQQRRQSVSSLCSDLSETSRNIIINDQWLVLGKIGQGSFGEVFEGMHVYPYERLCIHPC